MASIQLNGREIRLNDKGYLANFEDWDQSVAEALASQDQMNLTRCHWIAINFLRDFYRKFEVPPLRGYCSKRWVIRFLKMAAVERISI